MALKRHLERKHINIGQEEIKKICLSQRKRPATVKGKGQPCPHCPHSRPYVHLAKHMRSQHNIRSGESHRRDRIELGDDLQEYSALCTTLDGDSCSLPMARQYGLKLRQLCTGVGVTSARDLLDNKNLKAVQEWLASYAKEHKASSAATYISVCNNFASYLFKTNQISFPEFHEFKFRTNEWGKSSKKQTIRSEEGHRKPVLDDQFLAKFQASEAACEAKSLLRAAHNMNHINRQDHADVRNFLLLSTEIWNCCRSGIPATMTLHQFENREILPTGDSVVYVGYHKTVAQHGPVKLVLPKELDHYYVTYIDHVRELVLKQQHLPASTNVFLPNCGRSCSSDDVHKGINSFWKKAGGTGPIGATLLRASITTKVHSDPKTTQAEKQKLADHLTHNASIAEGWFVHCNIWEISLVAS